LVRTTRRGYNRLVQRDELGPFNRGHRRFHTQALSVGVLALSLILPLLCPGRGFAAADYAGTIAALIDPAKLATLGPRGANPRVQKAVYWLEMARQNKQKPGRVLSEAVRRAGYKNQKAADLTREALLRNLEIARKCGCLDKAGLEEMRHGQAATIQRGSHRGDQLSVDHIIPRDLAPELDCVIANLELMPLRANEHKSDRIGTRQRSLAQKLHAAGLLSTAGLSRTLSSR
jgi:hypothetical protein